MHSFCPHVQKFTTLQKFEQCTLNSLLGIEVQYKVVCIDLQQCGAQCVMIYGPHTDANHETRVEPLIELGDILTKRMTYIDSLPLQVHVKLHAGTNDPLRGARLRCIRDKGPIPNLSLVERLCHQLV